MFQRARQHWDQSEEQRCWNPGYALHRRKKGEFAACSKNGFAPKGLASKPCPFFSCNSKGTSWRVTLSRDKTVSGSSRTFSHAILLNLASRTRLLCHKELILEYSIPFEYVEEQTVRVQEEWYEKPKLLALSGWRWRHNHHRESTNCWRRWWRCA